MEPNWSLMYAQQTELLEVQKKLLVAQEKIADPGRLRGVEEGQVKMTEAVNGLSGKMDSAVEQLSAGVHKLSSTFWSLMKVPVAVVVVTAASWAFLYADKISERTWLLMLAVACFPWLGDSISAIGNIIRGRNGGHSGGKPN